MERVRQILLKNVEEKIVHSKNHVAMLDRRYKQYCVNRPADEFCQVNYHDPKDIQLKRIRLYEDRIDKLHKASSLSIHDTTLLDIDITYVE